MRFWQKIFLSMVSIFIISLDIGVFLFVSYSYDLDLKRETQNSIREYNVMLSSLYKSINRADRSIKGSLYNSEQLVAIILPLAKYYEKQDVYCALYKDDEMIYMNALEIPVRLLNATGANSLNAKVGDIRYLFVSSDVPQYDGLRFFYARNINALDEYKVRMSRVSLFISVPFGGAIGIATYLILKRLTGPIKDLNDTTREIANGQYDQRVYIRQRDEFGELGDTFNKMAASIQEKVGLLVQASEDKQRFIDNLSHEMKTPLTSILGYSEFLLNAIYNEEERLRATGYLYESAYRLGELSNKLMQLILIKSDGIELESVKLKTLFETVDKMLYETLNKRKITLVMQCEADEVLGDKALLLSMLTNLIENAARASTEGQDILLKAYMDQDVIWEITDHGIGMSVEELDKVMLPFYRVDKSRSRTVGGVGLGLSLCGQIAKVHNATLQIQSQIGKGTTIKITFTTF